MKAVNLTLYSTNPDQLDQWYEEYTFLGRNARRFRDRVVVYAYPRKPKPKPKHETKRGAKTESKAERTEQRSKRERWYD